MKSFLITTFLFLLIISSCTDKKHKPEKVLNYSSVNLIDTISPLVLWAKDSLYEIGSPSAYIDINKDTVIPFEKYSHCWTDTFKTFAIVFDFVNTENTVIGINQKCEKIFDAYIFDNHPDELSNGLFRVMQNGKIGFANKYGQIIIPCTFECAFSFENGKAKVTKQCTVETDNNEHSNPKSDDWYFIDKLGHKI